MLYTLLFYQKRKEKEKKRRTTLITCFSHNHYQKHCKDLNKQEKGLTTEKISASCHYVETTSSHAKYS